MSDEPVFNYAFTAPVDGHAIGQVLTNAKEIAAALEAGWPVIRIAAPVASQEH